MSKFDGYEEDAEEVAIMLTGKAYWYDSLHYAYTTITEEYAIIHNHVFQTLTSYKGKQYLVSVFNYVYVKNDPKQFFFSVARYDPKRDIPYEQRLNAAELSCKDRTNSFEEDEE